MDHHLTMLCRCPTVQDKLMQVRGFVSPETKFRTYRQTRSVKNRKGNSIIPVSYIVYCK